MRKTLRILGLTLALLCAPLAQAADLNSVNVTERAKLQRVPGFPVPHDPRQIFYLQRSSNLNTVVYVLRFDDDGRLNHRAPVLPYWRRYSDGGPGRGKAKALDFWANIAYGIRARPDNATPGIYHLSLKRLPQYEVTLRQTGPNQADLTVTLGGRRATPVYAYAKIDESGLIPKVTSIEIHGIEIATGRAITETFAVQGGEIRK